MKYRMLALALTLTGCDLLDTLEETIDPPPKVIIHENIIRECARDSVQLADALRFEDCGEPRPPSPGGGVPKATFSSGGQNAP